MIWYLSDGLTMREQSSDEEHPDAISTFERFDFQSLWRGREKVISTERFILTSLLSRTDGRRTLEIGTGEGRLSGVVQLNSQEYVGTDINPSFLNRISSSCENRKMRLLSSNLYHLPFRDNSFTTVVMIRVFNFLSKPESAMQEITRVLAPGGSLVMSYNPKPSIATFIDDLKAILRYSSMVGDNWKPVTFSTGDVVRIHPSSIPAFSFSVRYFARLMSESGLAAVAESASGLEDYRFVDRLPDELFQKMAFSLYRMPMMPTRFVLARKINGSGKLIMEADSIYCCPQCRSSIWLDDASTQTFCGTCGFRRDNCEGLPDLRYFPD